MVRNTSSSLPSSVWISSSCQPSRAPASATLFEHLAQVPGAKRVEILSEANDRVEARVYPHEAARATLTRSVAELAALEGWQIDEIHTEEGRLDEVFRTITLPDTAAV